MQINFTIFNGLPRKVCNIFRQKIELIEHMRYTYNGIILVTGLNIIYFLFIRSHIIA